MSNWPKAALERFEKAVRAHEMIGAAPPPDHDLIEDEYRLAKHHLVQKLKYRADAVTNVHKRAIVAEPKA